MTTMIAFLAAGTPEDKARKAAEALTRYAGRFFDDRFERIENRLGHIEDRLNRIEDRLGRIERRMAVMSWQVGTIAAVMVVVLLPALWVLVRVAFKVGALG
jgi:hypothetical protein